jgi:hypothetical protein
MYTKRYQFIFKNQDFKIKIIKNLLQCQIICYNKIMNLISFITNPLSTKNNSLFAKKNYFVHLISKFDLEYLNTLVIHLTTILRFIFILISYVLIILIVVVYVYCQFWIKFNIDELIDLIHRSQWSNDMDLGQITKCVNEIVNFVDPAVKIFGFFLILLTIFLIFHVIASIYINYYGLAYQLLNLIIIFVCCIMFYYMNRENIKAIEQKKEIESMKNRNISIIIVLLVLLIWFYLSYWLFGEPDGMIIEETDNSIRIIISSNQWMRLYSSNNVYVFEFSGNFGSDNTRLISCIKNGEKVDLDSFIVDFTVDLNFKYDESLIIL